MMAKEFKPITGFPGYAVSQDGEVKNTRTNKILTDSNGGVTLWKQSKAHRRSVDKLVKQMYTVEVKQKPKNLVYSSSNEIPLDRDAEYAALEALAYKLVSFGHTQSGDLEPIWRNQARFGSGRTVVGYYEAEDLVQEAIIAGYAALAQLDDFSFRPASYIAKAMRNKLYNLISALDPTPLPLELEQDGEIVKSYLDEYGFYDPDSDELTDRQRQAINDLRRILSKDEYDLLMKYYGGDYTQAELAEELEVTRETIGRKLRLILKTIKENKIW